VSPHPSVVCRKQKKKIIYKKIQNRREKNVKLMLLICSNVDLFGIANLFIFIHISFLCRSSNSNTRSNMFFSSKIRLWNVNRRRRLINIKACTTNKQTSVKKGHKSFSASRCNTNYKQTVICICSTLPKNLVPTSLNCIHTYKYSIFSCVCYKKS
jgi:hypothetical protein